MNSSTQSSTKAPALIFVFDKLPELSEQRLAKVITSVEPLKTKVTFEMKAAAPEALLADLAFETHAFQLVGFNAPVPASVTNYTIQVSHWQKSDKDILNGHKAHVICYYKGQAQDPTEQLIALYKVAYALCNEGLLGVLDDASWNCMPSRVVKDQMKPDMLASCRKHVPVGIWTGFVKFFKSDNSVWFCSKGFDRFGVNDFAYLGQPPEASFALNLFTNLFNYLYTSGGKMQVGHTAQLGADLYIRLREVYEYQDYLNGPFGTMVIEKIKASEINQKR